MSALLSIQNLTIDLPAGGIVRTRCSR